MSGASLALALSAGMLAAFNPCGFALLPAYLSRFLGLTAGQPAPTAAAGVLRAARVSGSMALGFLAVFGLSGLLVERLGVQVTSISPWITVTVGVVLLAVGVAMVLGFEPTARLPRLQRGTSGTGTASMALFGASYATVSLSCTLPLFLATVATTFGSGGLLAGAATFAAYSAGMGLVVLVLTVALALAQRSVVARLRGFVRWMKRVSGALLVVAGAYVAWYGWVGVQTKRGRTTATGPVDLVTGWSGTVSTWLDRQGGDRVALVLLAALAVVALAAGAGRRLRRG